MWDVFGTGMDYIDLIELNNISMIKFKGGFS
jgi:hypothetical protein